MFARAGQPELVRSNQKDVYYLGFLREGIGQIYRNFQGPFSWIKWKAELELLADICYFGLTTISGFQTLGEEYCNIVQVDQTRTWVPSAMRRGCLVLLYVFGPYVIEKMIMKLERRLQSQENWPKGLNHPRIREILSALIPLLRTAVVYTHRAHMALFYLTGVFYHIAKRITGVQYLLVRRILKNEGSRPTYRLLGYLSVFQLSISLLLAVYQWTITTCLIHLKQLQVKKRIIMAFATRTVIFIEMLTFGIGTFWYVAVIAREYNRVLIFKEPVEDKILPGHVIRTEKVANEGSCRVKCFLEPNCVSVNVGNADDQGPRICELNDLTEESPLQTGLTERPGHIHYSAENICHSNPCPGGNFICQVGFTAKRYRCVCRDGFKGENCDEEINKYSLDTGCGVSEYPPTVSSVSKAPDASTVSSSATQSADASSSEATLIPTAVSTAYPASTIQPPPQACQQGWNGNGTSCYKLFKSPELTWENAQEECKQIGANLVKIESSLKEKYLVETAYSRVNHYYWIGLSYSANDSVWKWADGTIWDGYQNWLRDNQRNFTHWSPCTVMHIIKWPSYYYAKWYLRSCSTRHGYICEKP